MFRRRGNGDEKERLDDFNSFLRSELTQELRQAVKLVQKEATTDAQIMNNDEHQMLVKDTEFTRELIVSKNLIIN